MEKIILSPITIPELETLIRDCVKSELQNHTPVIPPQDKENDNITRKEAAKILGISLPTLHDWSKRGIVKSYRIATRVRYKKAQVEAALIEVETIKYSRGI